MIKGHATGGGIEPRNAEVEDGRLVRSARRAPGVMGATILCPTRGTGIRALKKERQAVLGFLLAFAATRYSN